MRTNKIYILLAVFSIVFTSCSDDFLDTKPVISESSSSYYSNDNQMYNALISCYDVLQWSWNSNGVAETMSVIVPFSEIRSDNANTGGGTASDNIHSQASEAFTNDASNTLALARWTWDYQGINRCNLVINADYVQENPSDDVKMYVAEAKFLRAWYYFDLLRVFGPTPLLTNNVLPSDNYKFERASRDEINNQIIKDLTEAIDGLHKGKWGNGNVGRATDNIARSLLGKVYLYKADWNNDDKATFDKAAEQLKIVYNSGDYSLLDDYNKLFDNSVYNYGGENGPESIFEIQHCTTAGLAKGSTAASKSYFEGAAWVRWVGPRSMNTNSTLCEKGYGFMLPTQESVDYFTVDDSIRREAYYYDYDKMMATQIDGKVLKWDTAQYNKEDWYGYISGKYLPYKNYNIVGSHNFNFPGNERIIRFPDVILMLAECYLRGTNVNEGEAIRLINELRKAHLGKGTDNYLTVDQLKMSDPVRFQTTLDVIWYERRCEFAGEGDRWFDLVRTGRAPRIFGSTPPKGDYTDDWDPNNFDSYDIYMPLNTDEQIKMNNPDFTAYPDDSDREGLYPGVIDNTLESCRIESLPSKE